MKALKDLLFMLAQYVLPHHLLSRLVGGLAACRCRSIKNALIKAFIKRYRVNMHEARSALVRDYAHFNDFFTRTLKPGVRPFINTPGSIACPVDGTISQVGNISGNRIFQAKGHAFSTRELLGGSDTLATRFEGGNFATIYLSPRDYHRVHMPVSGTLREMVYVPGRLFSVSPLTTARIPNLFARNERMVAFFDTALGPMAVVMVGAMIVASIETVWAGLITPRTRQPQSVRYDEAVQLKKGEELGLFKMGSTVIVLFGPEVMRWERGLQAEKSVRMGQLLGSQNRRAQNPST